MSKKIALLILSLLFFHLTKAQSVSIDEPPALHDSVKNLNNEIFAAVQVEPAFPKGGAVGFNKFLAKTVRFPKYDVDNKVSGKVIVTFVVEKDGTLTNIKTLRSPDQYIAVAAEEAVALSPAWTPGTQNGQPVRVQFTISFSFSLANGN